MRIFPPAHHGRPVRRALVNSPAEWKWSSARWYQFGDPDPIQVDEMPAD
jgi:hypothetical protein